MSLSPPPRSAQVIIVGGGPAGAATAWYCARAGLDVVLLDRAHFPRAKPCAEYVSPEGARILAEMGALDALEARGSALTGMVVHAPSGDVIHGEFVARHGFRGFRDRGLGVRREVLDTILVECARAAGVRVAEGCKVEDVLRDARGQVSGVRLRDANGVHDVTSALVVGADGLRSVVSHRLGLSHVARWPRRVALVAHYHDVSGMTSLGEMHVTATGYVGLASVGDGVTNVALVVPAREAARMAGQREVFLQQWIAGHSGLAPRFARAVRVSPVRATGPFASRAKRPFAAGAALVGDAADFYDPFTGEGIYAALRGGELLSPFVVNAVQAYERGQARDALATLEAYDHARHRTFGGKWRVERLIGSAVSMPALLNMAARVLGRDRDLADLLIGVTGDFVPASAVLSPRTVLRFAGGLMRSLVSSPTADPPPPPLPRHAHRH